MSDMADKAAKDRRSSAAGAGETNSYANSRGRQVVSVRVLITFAQGVSTCRRSVHDAAQSRSLKISCRDLGKP